MKNDWNLPFLNALLFGLLITLFGATSATAAAPENAVINFGVPTTSGAANHMIVPDDIKLSEGGIANFIVGGFHFVTVYRVADNTRLSDIAGQITPGQDYVLLDKAGSTILDTAQRSAANPDLIDSNSNGNRLFIEAAASATARIVGVYFAEPGTYLVICGVKGHLDDAMMAVVRVKNAGDD